MEHFAFQGCSRLCQAGFSMETKNLYAATAKNWSRRGPYYHKCEFPSVSFRNITFHEPHCFVGLSWALRGGSQPSQAGWDVHPLEVVSWCPEELCTRCWENSRAIRRRNGRISIPRAREPGGKGEEWEEEAGVQVKGCWNQLERKWVWSWNCTEQTQRLVQLQPLQRSIFLPFMKEMWGQGLPRIDLWCSLLFPSFLFSKIFFLAANNAEGVGKRNPKQPKNPTSLEHLGT